MESLMQQSPVVSQRSESVMERTFRCAMLKPRCEAEGDGDVRQQGREQGREQGVRTEESRDERHVLALLT